jgi:hypothetical protein
MVSFSSTLPNILAQQFEGGGALARPAWFAGTKVTYERHGRYGQQQHRPESGEGRDGGYEQTRRTGPDGKLSVGQEHGEGAERQEARQRW